MKNLLSLLIGISLGAAAGLCHVHTVYDLPEPMRVEALELPVSTSKQIEVVAMSKQKVEPAAVLDEDIPDAVEEAAALYGEMYGICPEFLEAIAFYESSYRVDAENGSCIGLMQINIDAQYERMDALGVSYEDLYTADGSMYVAADYLQELFIEYGDAGIVLMKYNGDSRATEAMVTGELSDYAENVLELSEKLERKHGK